MNLNAKFWIWFAAFQVFFGLAVFAITRDHYIQATDTVSAHPSMQNQPVPVWSDDITETNIARLTAPAPSMTDFQNPAELLRQAEESFGNAQYERAADLYEQLLAINPNDAEIYNNLGLTLHYLGRSTEALSRLNEGIAVDADHQRTWLTLGYVNSQLGNIEQARTALNTAAQTGNDDSIRRSATKMLEELP